jgi:hypothetical protein
LARDLVTRLERGICIFAVSQIPYFARSDDIGRFSISKTSPDVPCGA